MTLLVVVLAVTVEALVEYGKSIQLLAGGHNKGPLFLQLAAVACSIALRLLSGADLYSSFGGVFALPVVGCTLTGIFASHGANYVSDLIGRLRRGGNSIAIEERGALHDKPLGATRPCQ